MPSHADRAGFTLASVEEITVDENTGALVGRASGRRREEPEEI